MTAVRAIEGYRRRTGGSLPERTGEIEVTKRASACTSSTAVGGVESRSGTTRSGATKTPRTLDRAPRICAFHGRAPCRVAVRLKMTTFPRGRSGRTALKPPSGATLTRAVRRPDVSIRRILAAAGRTVPVMVALGPCVLTTKLSAPCLACAGASGGPPPSLCSRASEPLTAVGTDGAGLSSSEQAASVGASAAMRARRGDQLRKERDQSGYSSLRQARGCSGCGFGVRASRKESYGATNGSGAITV